MHPAEADVWKNRVLEEVFSAIAASPELRTILVFKGARILAKLLPEAQRQSLDIDANCTEAFLATFPERDAQASYLRDNLQTAITKRFEAQEIVVLELQTLTVMPKPPRGHPLGWNAFEVKLTVIDHSLMNHRGVPSLRLDLAHPESLSDLSTSEIEIDGHQVTAYSLERIAGEKLRAFLWSLPPHQAKINRSGSNIRIKDLYDLTQIISHIPLTDDAFWETVSTEFILACESRGVDCPSSKELDPLKEHVGRLFERDSIIPRDYSFDELWNSMIGIVQKFEINGIAPFSYSLPPPNI